MAAVAVHAAAILILRLPAERDPRTIGPLVLVPRPAEVERPAADRRLSRPESGEEGAPTEAAERPTERPEPSIPIIRESPAAGEETTIPSTALGELHAATLPLVVSPEGAVARRRLERSADQIAIARAESLLSARMAGLAVVPVRDTGAIGLANGGITVAIPWQGLLPADRYDETWRKERCSGSDDGKADKPGEGEARRAQCG